MKEPENYFEPLPIFVYGTLRPGCSNYRTVVRFVERFSPAYLKPFQLYSFGGFPGIVPDPMRLDSVAGELLYIKPEGWNRCIHNLDLLESNGYLFLRNRFLAVNTETGNVELAWSYLANTNVMSLLLDNRIVSNDWLSR